jgi:hypothetical protein
VGVETHQRAVFVAGLVRQHHARTGKGMTLRELTAFLDFASPPPRILGVKAAEKEGLIRREGRRFFPVERR